MQISKGLKEDANSPLFCCCKSNHENQNNHIGNSKKIKELETKVKELSNKSRNVESRDITKNIDGQIEAIRNYDSFGGEDLVPFTLHFSKVLFSSGLHDKGSLESEYQ